MAREVGLMSRDDASEELEIALLVLSAHPEQLTGELAKLNRLAGYRLAERPAVALHDVYFDCAQRCLSHRLIALRVRMTNAGTRVTLKGPSEADSGGGVRRLEIEETFSEQGVRRILDALERRGAAPEGKLGLRPEGLGDDPVLAMRQLGLKVIQDRETRRVRRAVVPDRPGAEAIAELAFDATRYRIGGSVVTLHQIEIESEAVSGRDAIAALTPALERLHPGLLRQWDHGKLATGIAVGALIETGALAGLVSVEGTLDPRAYNLLAEHLQDEASHSRQKGA